MLRTATTRLADRARRLATSAAPRLASRPRGPRAAAFGAAVTAAFLVAQNVVLAETPSGSEDAPKRKPIYDDNETKLPPPPPPSDLELFIRKLRHTVTASWDDARDGASGLVDRWIKFEQATEAAIKSVVDSKEPFLPGAALLGGSFLAGVAVARKRGFLTRLLTPLTFTAISAVVIYPRTTRNVVIKAGGQPVIDALSFASESTHGAFDAGINAVFGGIDKLRKGLSGIVGKTEDVVSEGVKDAVHAPEKISKAIAEAAEKAKQSLDHPREPVPKEWESGADLHVRGPESYASLEVDAADKPSGTSPPSVIGDAIHKVEHAIEDAVDSVKKALDHPREKVPKEWESGADLHVRGPESYASLEVAAADKPSGASPPSAIGDAIHKVEHVIEDAVDSVKKALDHPREKVPKEWESGADLHVRGPESYASLEVAAADKPSGASPPSAIGDAIHKVEHVIEDAVDSVKKALDHPREKVPKEWESGADLHVRGPESYASLEVAAADKPSGTSPPSVIGNALHKVEEVIEDAVESVKKALDHPREKVPKEWESGADLHTRGPESYGSLEVAAADKPSGTSPPSVVGDAIHKAEEVIEGAIHRAEEVIEEAVESVKKALDHPREKVPKEWESGADLHTRGPESYVSLEVDAAENDIKKK